MNVKDTIKKDKQQRLLLKEVSKHVNELLNEDRIVISINDKAVYVHHLDIGSLGGLNFRLDFDKKKVSYLNLYLPFIHLYIDQSLQDFQEIVKSVKLFEKFREHKDQLKDLLDKYYILYNEL